ncbi:MAG: transcriptional repressor LexA [Ignavibacteria bacterium]|jgi:repressor LexA
MKKELTKRQKEILDFIQGYIELNGYAPSYRDIAKHFNMASTFGVKRHIDALEKKGYLTSGDNQSRALSIVYDITSEYTKSVSNDNVFEIPILGRVAAGFPILAEENIEGSLIVDQTMVNKKSESFGLKVRGDSMMNAGILEGDVIIVNKQPNARNGEIIVAMVGDEATVKRYERDGDTVLLIPENENYPTITLNKKEEFSIIGKVVGVYRRYN